MSNELQALAEELAGAAISAAEENWYEETKPLWTDVKNSAKNFLNAYKNYENSESFQNDFSNSIATQLKAIGRDKIFGDDAFVSSRAVYLLGFKFQNSYQRYFGELPSEVVYVTRSGGIYRGSIQQLALASYGKVGQARVKGLSGRLIKEQDVSQTLLDNYKDIVRKMKNYYSTIEKITSNWDKDKKLASQFYYSYTKKNGEKALSLIRQNAYVKFGSQVYKVLNYGDLAEALVSTYIAMKNDKGAPTEEAILQALSKVDNIGAFFKEDVGNLAVKSRGASLPQLQEFVAMAEEVIASGEEGQKKEFSAHKEGVRNIALAEAEAAASVDLGLGISLLDILVG